MAERAHDEPATAEALMRSRFDAYRGSDTAWLLRTWHPTTRPASLDLSDQPVWRGLQVVDRSEDGDAAVVEFRATYLAEGGGVGVMHERSRFIREAGRWFYLDGEMRSAFPESLD